MWTAMLHFRRKSIKLWQCIMNCFQHYFCPARYLNHECKSYACHKIITDMIFALILFTGCITVNTHNFGLTFRYCMATILSRMCSQSKWKIPSYIFRRIVFHIRDTNYYIKSWLFHQTVFKTSMPVNRTALQPPQAHIQCDNFWTWFRVLQKNLIWINIVSVLPKRLKMTTLLI